MKILSLYWPLFATFITLGPLGTWGAIKASATHRNRLKQERLDNEVDSAVYYEPSAQQNIVQLNQAAGLLTKVCEAADDPLIEIQLGGLRTEVEDFLGQLARRGVRPGPAYDPRWNEANQTNQRTRRSN